MAGEWHVLIMLMMRTTALSLCIHLRPKSAVRDKWEHRMEGVRAIVRVQHTSGGEGPLPPGRVVTRASACLARTHVRPGASPGRGRRLAHPPSACSFRGGVG